MRQQTKLPMVRIMACRLLGAKLLSEPMLVYTPFAKSNGRFFFTDAKINMMPSSDLCDFWWVHEMHASVYFLYKIY